MSDPRPTPRETHLAEQAQALDRETAAEWGAYIAGGGELDDFRPRDHAFLELLKEHLGEVARPTCGHALGELTPLYWSPRAPDELVCRACADRPDPVDTCDDCGALSAVAWREIDLPRTVFELGWPVAPPVVMRLRFCDDCFENTSSSNNGPNDDA